MCDKFVEVYDMLGANMRGVVTPRVLEGQLSFLLWDIWGVRVVSQYKRSKCTDQAHQLMNPF